MGSSLLVSFVIAIPLGLFTGVKKNSFFDRIVNFISYVGISMPVFWFALLLVYLFSLKLNLLPSMGMRTVGKDSVWDIVQHGILPCMVLAFQNVSVYMRYIRFKYDSAIRRRICTNSICVRRFKENSFI